MSADRSILEIGPGRWQVYCKTCGKRSTRRVLDSAKDAMTEWHRHKDSESHRSAVAWRATPQAVQKRIAGRAEQDFIAEILGKGSTPCT